MPREQAEKLKRYFINANPFLWGVLEKKNKKDRIEELQSLGFLKGYLKGSNATYSKINQDLLIELGIEGILDKIVLPKLSTSQLYTIDVLEYFRRFWEQGQIPDLKYLMANALFKRRPFALEGHEVYSDRGESIGYKDPSYIFVQIDAGHNFVERWTVFAGLWFEEIAPLVDPQTMKSLFKPKRVKP